MGQSFGSVMIAHKAEKDTKCLRRSLKARFLAVWPKFLDAQSQRFIGSIRARHWHEGVVVGWLLRQQSPHALRIPPGSPRNCCMLREEGWTSQRVSRGGGGGG